MPLRVLLVCKTSQELAVTMLQAGACLYKHLHPEHPLSVTCVTFEEYAELQIEHDLSDYLICIDVSETVLSQTRTVLPLERLPCLSLAVAQKTIRADEKRCVILIQSTSHITGVDIAASLLMGVGGVVNDRGLASASVLDVMINHQCKGKRHRSVLLVGEPLLQVQTTKSLLDEWYADDIGNNAIDLNGWQACFALAQLDRLEPLVAGGGQPYSATRLADALNLISESTGFRLTQNDLRRSLSVLAQRLLGIDHEPIERRRLPDYVRASGFPRTPPTITGIPPGEVAGRLYRILRGAEIVSLDSISQLPCGVVRLEQELYRRHARIRSA